MQEFNQLLTTRDSGRHRGLENAGEGHKPAAEYIVVFDVSKLVLFKVDRIH